MAFDPQQNRIVCAANRYNTGELVVGIRHYDHIMYEQAHARGLRAGCAAEQGFLDRYGQFRTREEAWAIAEAAGQIIRRVGGDEGKLFSENLY